MPIRPRHLILSMLLALPLCSLSLHAQQATGLQQRMSDAEFKAAGLDKLSPQELANLDSWLSTHGKVTTKLVDTNGKPVFYADKSERVKFNAHIVGHFGGWHGQDEFTLDNGQVWKQADTSKVSCLSSNNPKVTIRRSLMGNWMMAVDGCNDTTSVVRTK